MRMVLLALCFALAFTAPVTAADYAGAISAFRRAHGLNVVKLDAKLNAAALKQAQAMAATGSISHSAAGSFSSRMTPLRRQLAQRPWRRLFADQVAEGLAAMRAEGIRPVSPTAIPAGWMPPLLRLPDMIFEAMLGRTMKIDPEARSSMWEDLQRGRRTEIDYLQGVITDIAERRGLDAPLSHRIVALIRKAEADGKGSPGLSPEQLRG